MPGCEVADDGAAEVVSAIEKAFAALEAERPGGLRYAYLRRAGSGEFLSLLQLDEGAENPLPGIEAASNAGVAVADLARARFVLANSSEVGVPRSWLPLLAALKGAGAAGLLLGWWARGPSGSPPASG